MVYGFLNCFGGYALKLEAARGSLALANRMGLSLSARTATDVPRARNYGAPAARRSKGQRGRSREPRPTQRKRFTVWMEHRPSRF